ncbi:MAG: serine/threonine-protein kinase [Vicinamibacterales bacterium]
MSLQPGARLGPYEILSLIGSGGMGEVYRARDPKLNRAIAIKILPEHLAADAERRLRFEREAQSLAALSHPNIVTIHSVEQADGILFLTMECVEGKPLSALIAHGGLPLDRLLGLALPLADAVSAAHLKGITHRDLKPANVMVTDDGRVKGVLRDLAVSHDGQQLAVTETEGSMNLSRLPLTATGGAPASAEEVLSPGQGHCPEAGTMMGRAPATNRCPSHPRRVSVRTKSRLRLVLAAWESVQGPRHASVRQLRGRQRLAAAWRSADLDRSDRVPRPALMQVLSAEEIWGAHGDAMLLRTAVRYGGYARRS